MPIIDPDRLARLPIAFMNDDHGEEARRVNAVGETLDALDAGRGDRAAVVAALEALYAHTQAHFSREEEAMVASSFPATSFHRADHERTLSEIGEAERQFKEGGEAEELRTFVQTLPGWLSRHIDTMDSVTARYLAEWGG